MISGFDQWKLHSDDVQEPRGMQWMKEVIRSTLLKGHCFCWYAAFVLEDVGSCEIDMPKGQ